MTNRPKHPRFKAEGDQLYYQTDEEEWHESDMDEANLDWMAKNLNNMMEIREIIENDEEKRKILRQELGVWI